MDLFSGLGINEAALLPLFWAIALTLMFNAGYVLRLDGRQAEREKLPSPSRKRITMLVGTLIIVGTYGQTLAQTPFELQQCVLLATVAAHGWTADGLVQSFLERETRHPVPVDEPVM